MKVINIINAHTNNINFTAARSKRAIPKSIINHFGLNMETLVGYKGKKKRMPPPETIDKNIAMYFNKLQVDWRTHVKK